MEKKEETRRDAGTKVTDIQILLFFLILTF